MQPLELLLEDEEDDELEDDEELEEDDEVPQVKLLSQSEPSLSQHNGKPPIAQLRVLVGSEHC